MNINNVSEATGGVPVTKQDSGWLPGSSQRVFRRRQQARPHVEDASQDSGDVVCDNRFQEKLRQKWEEAARKKKQKWQTVFAGGGSNSGKATRGNTAAAVETLNDEKNRKSSKTRKTSRGRRGSAATENDMENEDDDVVCDDAFQELRQKWEEAARKKKQQKPMGFAGVGSSSRQARCGSTAAAAAAAVETRNEGKSRESVGTHRGNCGRDANAARAKGQRYEADGVVCDDRLCEDLRQKRSVGFAGGGSSSKKARCGNTGAAVETQYAGKPAPSPKKPGVNRAAGNANLDSGDRKKGKQVKSCEISGAGTESINGKKFHPDLAVNEPLNQKEKWKESEAYKRADEEEWRRRDAELKRQALEAQRLRRVRKKEEATQARPRQRLEDHQTRQQLEESTRGLKEQLRGNISSKLEGRAAECRDRATLLKEFGIAVEGGRTPTSQCYRFGGVAYRLF